MYYANDVLYTCILYAGYSYSYGSFFHGDTVNLNAPIVLNSFDCSGTETKLTDCDTYEDDDYLYESYCSGAAGVMCEGTW